MTSSEKDDDYKKEVAKFERRHYRMFAPYIPNREHPTLLVGGY